MPSQLVIDLSPVAQDLGLAQPRVATVIELLDGGNTVPFITRYRKDQTGGLDEEQIRQIQSRVAKLRLFSGTQTDDPAIDRVAGQAHASIGRGNRSGRHQQAARRPVSAVQASQANAGHAGAHARARTVGPGNPGRRSGVVADLDARAADFVNLDRQVTTGADALLGAGHILAEMFSERARTARKLRAIIERTGHLVSTAVEPENKPDNKPEREPGSRA